MQLKFVADSALLGLDILSGHELSVLPGREITAEDLVHADALLVRSVTSVDRQLLSKAKQLKFVGTATIGTDHIDKDLLKNRGIAFSSAAGCNANAVVDYVLAIVLDRFDAEDLAQLTIGIAGYGNVGSRLAAALDCLSIAYKVYDPLLTQDQIPNAASYEELLRCDVISLHVPLSKDGPHPSYHWFDRSVFARLDQLKCLINTSRGNVIEEAALLEFLEYRDEGFFLALDVWPNEPDLNQKLIRKCDIATPHVAGHSRAGKLRGSLMIFKSLAKSFACELALDALSRAEAEIASNSTVPICMSSNAETSIDLLQVSKALKALTGLRELSEAFSSTLLSNVDDRAGKRSNISGKFEKFRRAYKPRGEWLYDH